MELDESKIKIEKQSDEIIRLQEHISVMKEMVEEKQLAVLSAEKKVGAR